MKSAWWQSCGRTNGDSATCKITLPHLAHPPVHGTSMCHIRANHGLTMISQLLFHPVTRPAIPCYALGPQRFEDFWGRSSQALTPSVAPGIGCFMMKRMSYECVRGPISADPGLCQGRGGAWDHRRCGTWLSGRKQRHTPFQGNNSVSYMPQPSTCPSHLHAPAICFSGLQGNNSYSYMPLFRGFKTTVCPASNPPNPSAGLQGNNSYSYMPLPSVFQGVQDCRLPALKPSKRFCRPPRQQLLQLHAPALCFSAGSRLPFARPQTLQTLPQASKATTLTTTCPCHLFFRGFKTAVCPPSNPPNPFAGLQGSNSYSYMPLPSVFQGVQDCRLPALKPSKRFRRPPRQQLLQLHAPALCFSAGSRLPFARPQTLQTLPQASKATTLTATCPCHLPSVFQRVQDCRLPALKPSKPFRRPPRQQLLQLHAPAICFSGGSRLPFARPQTLQTLPQASKATTLTATCPCPLFFSGFKTAVCPPSNPPNASAGLQGNNSYSYMPLPSVFQGVQDCRLPGLKPSKPFRRPPRQQLLQLHAPAICFSGGSRLPFARPQTLQTLPQASKATTLTATCPCPLFFSGFKTAVCPPSNPPNASASLQGNNSYSYMPLPSVFQRVQDCRLPALKPSKRFRRPPRQQLLQLHAPAICFSGGSRLPFARPQTLQTLPQASKATTLTATCPCSMPLPSVFLTATCPCLAGTWVKALSWATKLFKRSLESERSARMRKAPVEGPVVEKS